MIRDFLKISGPPILMCVPLFYWMFGGAIPFWVAAVFLFIALWWYEVLAIAIVGFRAVKRGDIEIEDSPANQQ